ncbi:hypothetical protein FIM40_05030 [Helicobacter pylori]|nr:hypothetical protein FIM40_05030 [Helicobacter pylori]
MSSILKNAFERFYFLRKMADCSQSFFNNKTQSAKFLVKILLVSIRLLLRNIILSLLKSS